VINGSLQEAGKETMTCGALRLTWLQTHGGAQVSREEASPTERGTTSTRLQGKKEGSDEMETVQK